MAIPARRPPVAVLLPVRNAAPTLEAALESLRRQTLAEFEVLAVDDGSTDAGPDILHRFAGRDPRFRILSSGGAGLIESLELARKNTQAPHLARMDADDFCHRDRLALQLAYLDAHPEVAAVGSRVRIFPTADMGPGWRRYRNWLNRLITPEDHAREMFVESPLAHPSVLMRAEAVETVGGYRDRGWPEDYDLWLRMNAERMKLAKVDRVLLAWRQTPGRLSLRHPRYRPEAFLRARAHFLAQHLAGKPGPVEIWGAGRTGRRLGKLLIRSGIRVAAFYDLDPRKIGRLLLGAPVRSWREVPSPNGARTMIGAVSSRGARRGIRDELRRRGYREGVDFVAAA